MTELLSFIVLLVMAVAFVGWLFARGDGIDKRLHQTPEPRSVLPIQKPITSPVGEPAENKSRETTVVNNQGFTANVEHPQYVPLSRRSQSPPESVGDSYEFMVRGGTKPTLNGPTKRMRLYPLLTEGQTLRFVRRPANETDRNGVLIYPSDGRLGTIDLGYVPDHVSLWLTPILDRGAEFEVKVTRVVIRGANGQWPSLYAQMIMTKAPGPAPKRKPARKAASSEACRRIAEGQ